MSGLEALGPIAEALDGASSYYEFWKEYKGEEIQIRTHHLNIREDSRGSVAQTARIIQGTVESVQSFPPGFLLSDVQEVVSFSDVNVHWGAGSTEVQGVSEGPEGEQILREVDEKYVSFSAIEELERVEVASEAIEPFRED